MRDHAPLTSPRSAIPILNWSRYERRATTTRFSRNPPTDSGDRPGVHLRVGHGQNQRHCPDASNLARLVHWIFDCLQPYGALAAVPQPVDLGRLRRLDLRHGFADVLVRWSDPGLGDTERSLHQEADENYLRHAVDGLARFGASLAPLPVSLFASCRPGHAAGSFCAHRREL